MNTPARHFYEFGGFRLDPDDRLLVRDGRPVAVTPKAIDLLLALLEKAGRVVTKEELTRRLWPDTKVSGNSLPQAVALLRRAFVSDPEADKYIETIPKRGYRFVAEVREIRDVAASSANLQASAIPSAGHLLAREQDLKSLLADVAAYSLTTIVGPPGFGKTSLAILAAQQLQGDFKDGIWFVPLDTISGSADEKVVVQTIAAALGERTEHENVRALVRLLARKHLLLILDACEPVLDHCENILSALSLSCRELKILATSRQSLCVSGEKIWNLGPLDLPEEGTDDWEVLDQFLCVALFVRAASRTEQVLPRNVTTARETSTICRLCEGIPLAIELAASMTGHSSLEEIICGLRRDFRMGGTQESKLYRQIARSYRLLPPHAKELLGRLAVFAGGWTEEAAEAVCAGATGQVVDVSESLQHLVESSLVTPAVGYRSRHRMLDMTRAFAQAKLRESGQAEAFLRAHFSYFHRLCENVGQAVWGRDMLNILSLIDEESSNVLRAMEWSLRNSPIDGLAFCVAIWPYWMIVGQIAEGREWLKAFMRAAPDCPQPMRVRAWSGLGSLAYFQSDYDDGILYCEKALGLARSIGDWRSTVTNLITSGNMRFHREKEFEIAFRYFAESIALASAANDRWLLSLAVGNLAMHRACLVSDKKRSLAQQEAAEIVDAGLQSVSAARELGNPWLMALSLMNRASSLRFIESTRDWDLIENLYKEAFRLRYDTNDKYGMIQSVYKLAAVACERSCTEQYARAATLLGGLSNLVGGRERIPIPKHNEADFRWTVDTCQSALGETEFHRHFVRGTHLSIAELANFALSRRTGPAAA